MGEEIVEPALEVLVCLDIHGTSANLGKKVVEGFTTCETFYECSDKTDGFGDVLLWGGIIGTFEGRRLMNFCGGVDGLV